MPAATKTPPAAEESQAPAGRKKLPVVLGAVVLVVLAAAAAWFFLLRGTDAEAAEPEPQPGEVLALEPVSVNLAQGAYLRVGLALQLTAEAHEPDGSEALDLTIATFSGRSAAELSDLAVRDELKAQLEEQIDEAYHHEVMDIYFTEFVTQ